MEWLGSRLVLKLYNWLRKTKAGIAFLQETLHRQRIKRNIMLDGLENRITVSANHKLVKEHLYYFKIFEYWCIRKT